MLGSSAGLACATALAGRGAPVAVLDGKQDAGEKLHTTGILVRDALADRKGERGRCVHWG